MNKQDLAMSYFNRIPDGRRYAIARPYDPSVDRTLRDMINKANKNGDCIIDVGNVYYRPIPGNAVDEKEFKEYIGHNDSKALDVLAKNTCMREAFESKRKEIAYAKQQAERKKGRA